MSLATGLHFRRFEGDAYNILEPSFSWFPLARRRPNPLLSCCLDNVRRLQPRIRVHGTLQGHYEPELRIWSPSKLVFQLPPGRLASLWSYAQPKGRHEPRARRLCSERGHRAATLRVLAFARHQLEAALRLDRGNAFIANQPEEEVRSDTVGIPINQGG